MISAKFVPLKYYTLSSQLRRLTAFSVGLFWSANSVTRSYPVMRKSCIIPLKRQILVPGVIAASFFCVQNERAQRLTKTSRRLLVGTNKIASFESILIG